MEGYRGIGATHDTRFADKESKLLKKTKFPACFTTKVDMRKVNVEVMRPWVVATTKRMLGIEDDVLIEFVQGQLDNADNPVSIFQSICLSPIIFFFQNLNFYSIIYYPTLFEYWLDINTISHLSLTLSKSLRFLIQEKYK